MTLSSWSFFFHFPLSGIPFVCPHANVCAMLVGAQSFVRDGQTFYLLNQAPRSQCNFTFPLSDNVSLHPSCLIAPPPKTTLFTLFFFLLLLFSFTTLGSLLVPVSQQYSLQCFQLRQKIPSSLWHSYGGICKHFDSGSSVSSDGNQDLHFKFSRPKRIRKKMKQTNPNLM